MFSRWSSRVSSPASLFRLETRRIRELRRRRQQRRLFVEALEDRRLLATLYWQGDDGTNPTLWSVAANWNTLQNGTGLSQTPASTDTLVFDSATTGLGSTTPSNDVVGLTGITLQITDATAGVPNFTIGGTQLVGLAGLTANVATAADTATVSLVMSGTGGVTNSGAGTLALTGVSSFSGTTTISAGTIAANSTTALGDGSATNTLILNGGTLRATAAITSPATRGVTLSAASVIDVTNVAVSIAGTISGGVSGSPMLTVNATAATGSLTLSGANDYLGQTVINRGSVVLQSSTALGASGNGNETTVNGNDAATSTTLSLNPATGITVAETLNLAANGTGRVSLVNTAQGNTISGNIDVSSTGNLVQFNSAGGSLTVTGDITGAMSGGALLFLRGVSTSTANHLQGSVNLTGG